ncbi:unnamed protein product [Soboliphyme baturini]|uniref:Glutamate receptor 1 n=1 Tax=Soboliphyme baturini TaxID=241478 RepID=A0A183IN21_9BILA|nr:unnamed protein product [Soboliphyme baturini]
MSAFTFATMEKNSNQSSSMFRFDSKKGILLEENMEGWGITRLACQILKDGIFVLLGSGDSIAHPSYSSLSDELEIPFVNWALSEAPGRFEVALRPPITAAVGDVIRQKGWRNFTYIYDSNDGLYNLKNLLNYLKSRKWTTFAELLKFDVEQHDYFTFFLRFHTTHPYKYNHSLSMKEVERFKNGLINITGFQVFNGSSPRFQRFIRAWSRLDSRLFQEAGSSHISVEEACAYDSVFVVAEAIHSMLRVNASLFQKNFNRDEMWNFNHKGIFCYPQEDRDDPNRPFITFEHGRHIYTNLKRVSMDGITGHIKFDDNGRRKNHSFEILDLEFSGQNVASSTMKKYFWKDGVGILPETHEINQRNRSKVSLLNRTRIITTIINEPFFMLKKDAALYEGNDRFEGYCVDLAKLISEKIENFPYIIRPVKDNQYGVADQDGRWSGMIGELIRGEADAAIASLTINTLRERVVDFSKPFLITGVSIMIKKPNKQEFSVFSFMQPLSTEVWMYIIIAYIGVSVIIYFVSRISPKEWRLNENSDDTLTTLNAFSIQNCMWVTLAAFMQQGTDIMPRSAACRVAISVWWFFTMIIVSSYTANLAAFLTLEKMHAPIETAEDLARQTKIKYGIQSMGSTAQFFQESTVDVHRRMWQYMITQVPSVLVNTYAEGIQRVRDSKGQYAFLLEATANEYANTRKPCDTMKVGPHLNSLGYGIATPFGSDLRERINLAVLELQEIGELKRLEMKWWYEKGQCEQGISDNQSASLNLSKVAGIFYSLVVGIVVAKLAAMIQYLYHLRQERKASRVCKGDDRSSFDP